MTPINTNFYGDNNRWFIGTVIDNDDSPTGLNLTRVKVRIFGVHDNIPIAEQSKLPWASVVLPTTEGGNGTGGGAAIDVGAQVFGIFLDGKNSQYPLVLGSIPFAYQSFDSLNPNNPGNTTTTAYYGSSSGGGGRRRGAPTQTYTNGDESLLSYPDSTPLSENLSNVIVYEFFRERGYSDAQARGIFGNLAHESAGFDPAVLNFTRRGDSGTAYGIAQWRNDRKDNLYIFARERNINPKALRTQLRFVDYELNGSEGAARTALLQCTTPAQAAVSFARKYERPASLSVLSRFPNPVYSGRTNNSELKRAGEDDRIERAIQTTFELTAPQRNVE